MVKHLATLFMLFAVDIAFAEEDAVLKALLGRVPAILEVSKPALKFLNEQHITTEAKQIEAALRELYKLVNKSDLSSFGIRARLLASERKLISYIKEELLMRAEILNEKATEIAGQFPDLSERIQKEQLAMKQIYDSLRPSVNQYDKNIQLEKDIIAVQDRLETILGKAHSFL